MFRLDRRTAVVTGAGSGIGRAIALKFAAQGARVFVADLNLDAARETARLAPELAQQLLPCQVDVTSEDSVTELMRLIERDAGGLQILVNNAGVSHVGTVESTTRADFERLFRVNVEGVFLCSKAALPLLLANDKSSVLNIASIASLIGLKDRFAYSMTKGAVLTMTYSLAVDYVERGLRCNAICPARVHTPFVDDFIKRNYPGREAEVFDQRSRYQPVGRMGTPDEVAALAVYLCSDEASFVTGSAYPIDGGVTMQ